jgi:hypothetical protein
MKAFVPILILTWGETIGHNFDQILLRTVFHLYYSTTKNGAKCSVKKDRNTVQFKNLFVNATED